MKRLISVIISIVIAISSITVFAESIKIEDTSSYLLKTVKNPTVNSVGGEWTVIGLSRSGITGLNTYFDEYYKNVEEYVKANKGILSSRKYTEYSRVVTALCSIGKNPENVGDYNLVRPLTDFDKATIQGINGAVFALIALDSGCFGDADIRNKYIEYVLEREKKNGGWSLSDAETYAEPDITAMVLTALAPYTYRENVKGAVNRGVNYLSKAQHKSGGYSISGEETSESSAQVLLALCSLGISYSDDRFVKNGNSVLDAVLSYKNSDGSFSHTSKSDLLATEQCFYALVAAKRLSSGENRLFDMSDTYGYKNGLPGKNKNVNSVSVSFPGKTFDDIKNNKYKFQIYSLCSRGIINGYTSKAFAPEKTITRAEFAKITVASLGLPLENITSFNDVPSNEWFYPYVGTAHKYGIINGVTKEKFNPHGTITVEEACLMAERAASLCGIQNSLSDSEVNSVLSKYSDYKKISEWAKKGVAFCCKNGFLDTTSGKISPTTHIKRDEAAFLLYNILKGANLI